MENKPTNEVVATEQKAIVEENIQLKNNVISKKELQFILQQTFPTLTPKDFFYAISQCKAYGLDPRKKEIYFVPFTGKGGVNIASITSYEVYANELESSGYDFIPEWKGDEDPTKPLELMCRAKVIYKGSGALRYQTPWISIKEFAKMDYNKTKLVGMWAQFPTTMLEKCVLVRASRFVLGKNLGYTAEEMYNAKQYQIEKKEPTLEELQARRKWIDEHPEEWVGISDEQAKNKIKQPTNWKKIFAEKKAIEEKAKQNDFFETKDFVFEEPKKEDK